MKIFISYSREDEGLKDDLLTMLRGIEREGIITIWHDSIISPGDTWREEIKDAIKTCDIGLLLISSDFIASEFIHNNELKQLLIRRNQEGLLVIPIILRDCLWKEVLGLGEIQALPKSGKAVITFSKELGERDSVWKAIAEHIKQKAENLPDSPPDSRDSQELVTKYIDKLTRHLEDLLWTLEKIKSTEEGDIIPRFFLEDGRKRRKASPRSLTENRSSFIIYGPPGSGKSTCLCLLAQELLRQKVKTSDSRTLLPIYIKAQNINESLKDFITSNRGDKSAVPNFLRQQIWEALFKPWDYNLEKLSNSEADKIDCLDNLIAEEYHLVFIFEGFDELVAKYGLDKPLTELFVEQLKALVKILKDSSISFIISSRNCEKAVLQPLQLISYEFEKISDTEVNKYLLKNKGWDSSTCNTITKFFINDLDAIPLYLSLLCDYISSLDSPIDSARLKLVTRESLIHEQVKQQFEHNKNQSSSQFTDPYSSYENIQRKCLRRIAGNLIHQSTLNDHSLTEIVENTLKSEKYPSEDKDDIKRAIQTFLVNLESKYSFRHFEYRDYWIADAVLEFLLTDHLDWDTDKQDLLRSVLIIPRVLDIFIASLTILKESNTGDLDIIKTKLKNITEKACHHPPSRNVRSIPAIGLSIIVRAKWLKDLKPNCSNQCFQGLTGAGSDFSGTNFQNATLTESNLCGAILSECNFEGATLDNVKLDGACLQNANLKAANLRNVSMGEYEKDPTDLSGSELSESNWFNIRIPLKGYLQFWTGRFLSPNDNRIMLSTSSGALRLVGRQSIDPEVISFSGIHSADLLDFDISPQNKQLVTCSRDGRVLLHLYDLDHAQKIQKYQYLRLAPTGLLIILGVSHSVLAGAGLRCLIARIMFLFNDWKTGRKMMTVGCQKFVENTLDQLCA